MEHEEKGIRMQTPKIAREDKDMSACKQTYWEAGEQERAL